MTKFTNMLPIVFAAVVLFASASTSQAAKSAEPSCCSPVPPQPCCYEPCFKYKTHGLHAKKALSCSCTPPTEAILQVTDPRCNCYVDVPICLPACCEGVPSISSRCGLFKRGIVEYEWCCGFKVKVVFKGCDKVDVHYYGK